MRLGVAYNLYDGEELLEASLKSIREVVDFITVIYQDVSNKGEKRADSLLPFLTRLKESGLLDDFVLYSPTMEDGGVGNERRKRIIGMECCRAHGCNYYLSMDVDEFYRAEEIRTAKKFILDNGIDISTVSIIEYVKSPTYRLLSNYMFPPNRRDYMFYCPFIMRIKRAQEFGLYHCFVDPTRSLIKRGRSYLFPKHEIAMHHMSTIRKDLARKYRNSSLALLDAHQFDYELAETKRAILEFDPSQSTNPPPKMMFIGEYPILKVDNEFGIEV